MATPVVASGDYLVEVDTGFDFGSFTLDDALKAVLNNTEYTLGPNITYADITPYVKRVSYKRGRQRTTDQFGAGTMQVLIDDELAGGALSPYDQGSPYYDPANNQPGIAPLRAIRLSRDGEYLFQGVITDFTYQFDMGGDNTVLLNCADGFYKLAQAVLDELNVSAETSGERIETVLDLPEVDLFPGAERNVDIGTVDLGHDAVYTIPAGTNALAYIQQINQTAEFGRVFMARDGVFTFQPRIGQTLSGPVITFNDTGTGAKYNDLEIAFDASHVVNRAVVTALDDKTATSDDLSSQATYFVQATDIGNSLLHVQSQIDAAAAYLIEGTPEPRFTSVQTYLPALTSLQRDTITTIDIGDTITIAKQVTGVGTISEELSVEGIEGRIDFDTGHTIRFYTADTTIVYLFKLDDPIYGTLNTVTNVLG